MNIKRIILWLPVLMLVANASAQTEEDALMFSRNFVSGTARSNAMAGSFGALGGDLSVLSTNPAGIGFYRKGEFSFTPGLDFGSSSSTYFGNTTRDNFSNPLIGNIGLVGVYDGNKGNGWISSHLGVAYNRTGSFNRRVTIDGANPNSSILDVMAFQAHGVPEEDLVSALETSSSLAYWTYLINPNPDGTYSPEIQSGITRQTKTITEEGSMGSTDVTFGGNYNNQVFVGGSLGFPRIRHNRVAIHLEEPSDTNSLLSSLEYYEDLSTRGNGFNMKLGAIFRPVNAFRFGIALHSPTWLSLNHSWHYSMQSRFDDGFEATDESTPSTFSYRINTPWKGIASAAFVFGKAGVINFDYEYQDFRQARMSSSRTNAGTYSFVKENQNINNFLSDVHNFRVGTEWRVDPLRLRAGYAYYMNPYNDASVVTNSERSVFSGGVGVRYNDWFLDASYSLSFWNDEHVLYDPSLTDVATIDQSRSNITLTVGFRY